MTGEGECALGLPMYLPSYIMMHKQRYKLSVRFDTMIKALIGDFTIVPII